MYLCLTLTPVSYSFAEVCLELSMANEDIDTDMLDEETQAAGSVTGMSPSYQHDMW